MSAPTTAPAGEQAPATPPAVALLHLILGRWVSMMVCAAAELGVADHLRNGPRTADDLARETQADPSSLYRLLRGLANYGVFAEVAPRTFGLTPLGNCLRSDVYDSMRGAARMMGSAWHLRAWEDIVHSVRTGQPGFDAAHGCKPFDYFTEHPEAAEIFNQTMIGFSRLEHPAIVAAYDFGRFGSLMDVAGGRGHLLAAILKEYPAVKGIVYDLPHVVESARQHATETGLPADCRFQAGSFFESIPAGADAYMMKFILHDWNDAECGTILGRCREAMGGKATLLVIEHVIQPDEPSLGKLLDIEMLVVPGGRERTEDEYRALFAASGLRLNRVVRTSGPLSIMEVVPA